MPSQRTQEVKIAPGIIGSLTHRSLAVKPILKHLFDRLEGDCVEFMRLELGVAFRWSMWLRELLEDLVLAGVVVKDPWYSLPNQPMNYKLSTAAWLTLAREEQECQTQRRADCGLTRV